MRKLALVTALVLVCASSARAAGETFTLEWVTSYQCDQIAPTPSIRHGSLHIVSDTEWDVCTDLFLCALGMTTPVHGTWVRHSARRAVFVGSLESNLFYGGPTTIEVDLALDRGGEAKSARGTFIAPSAPGVADGCASRGKFRTRKRTD